MANVPPQSPVGDTFNGVILKYATAYFLSPEPILQTEVIASGQWTVRYGLRYAEKPHVSIVPGLVAVDYGEMMTGDTMWDFITNRSNIYPRADVLGYRNDGESDMVVLKKLDLGLSYHVLVYADDTATTPQASINAIIHPNPQQLSVRLQNYVPHFHTLSDWENRLNE